MAVELFPKQKKVIGFISGGVYYLDLDGENTLVVYGPEEEDVSIYPANIEHYRLGWKAGYTKNIFIEE